MERALVFMIVKDDPEMRSLLHTLKISIVKEFVQKRKYPHKVGFFGPGRLDEIEEETKDLEFDAIVIDGTLKPSQHHYLEMRFQKECIDRIGIILRIFAEHAHTPEAIAQVTLARLRYEQPFLREWIHKAKEGDRPGFLAGGAYATDVYFQHARSQVKRIEENLNDLSRQREITRGKRHAKGFSLVSLAGYTNAGKSALFNTLCKSDVEVDEKLFSTLSTTTRRISNIQNNILVVDTVGFIRDLPTDLVEAFNSTLEEIFYADLILLVFDGSEPLSSITDKLNTSTDILLPKIEQQILVYVASKIDLLSKTEKTDLQLKVASLTNPHPLQLVSAKTGEGIEELKDMIISTEKRSSIIGAELPIADATYSLLSKLRSSCTITERIEDKKVFVSVRCKPEEAQKVSGWLAKVGGAKITVQNEAASTNHSQDTAISSGNGGVPLQ